MNLLVLALFAAATNTQPANNTGGTTTKSTTSKSTIKPSKKTTATDAKPKDGTESQGAEKPADAKKKKGAEGEAAPADGSPASIVGNSVDAATQIANEAAKAAMEEVKRLQAIGGGSGGSVVDAKPVEAGVAGTAAVGKELSKAPKKKPAEDGASEDAPKPEKKKKPAAQDDAPSDGKVFGKKADAPQKQ